MGRENKTVKCPFCGLGEIDIIYMPASLKARKGPWGGSKAGILEISEQIIVTTEKCSNCGKTKNEIKSALKKGTGKHLSHEERLRRLREAGLPTVIGG